MTKLNSPLLSFEAHGSIGDSVSFTRRRHRDIAEGKPMLPYFNTLPVQYQRWLYQDYAAWWLQQTPATRTAYAARAARNHTTAIAEWLQYCLTMLPDIAALWHLDEITGSAERDASRNSNHATSIGTTPVTARIAHGRLFDGIDDYLTCPTSDSIDVKTFTFETFVYLNALVDQCIYCRQSAVDGGWQLFVNVSTYGGKLVFYTVQGAASQLSISATVLPIHTQLHIAVTFKAPDTHFFIQGAPDDGYAAVHIAPANSTQPAIIGRNPIFGYSMNGWMDEIRLSNRILAQSDILRHAERSYP